MATLVQVQTLSGVGGLQVAQQQVNAAVAAHNAANPKQQVQATFTVALAPNTKGMQVHLTGLAVCAANAGAVMVRLSVHGGNVALIGTAAQVQAATAAWATAYNQLATKVANAYNPAQHGGRVGFTNAWLCGAVAGMATKPTALAYGLGYLFTMPAPNATAYALGYAATNKGAAAKSA